ncbi:MAG: hypothetical protein U1B79_01245 [Candidatus Pacearchaeota archaeon]|nr:hypothetical protein [Nanoarchaeota archaeon]MDZ4226716.1 hypothetical protein [Candidatus Pacearchaeota archaeon]
MIKYREPLSMTESLEYIEDKKDSEADIKKFIKKFVKLKPEEGRKLREKLSSLGLLKLKHESISKVVDIMPENQENLNKIFTDVGLDEDESKKILDTIEEFR